MRALTFFRLPTVGLTLLLATPWQAALAVPDDDDLAMFALSKSTISLATGANQSLRRAPAVASVITAEDIASMGATDLDQVLETVPGIHVTRAATGYPPIYIIRGIGAGNIGNPQVLMLLNGIRLNSTYSGDKGNLWGSMPLTNVARIEIIRGPGSALYGADAYAGVINVITKSVEQMQGVRAGVLLGSFQSRDGWIEYGDKLGQLGVAAYLQIGKTDGPHTLIEADAQTLNDHRFGTHASLAPGPLNLGRDAADARLELSYQQWRWRSSVKWRDKMGFGAGINSALDPNHTGKSETIVSDLSWTDPNFADAWSVGTSLSYTSYTEQTPDGIGLFPPGTRIGPNLFPDGMIGGPGRWERAYRASAFASYGGWRQHTLRLGVGHDDLYLYRIETFKNFLLTPAGVPVPTGPVIDYGAIQPHILPQRRLLNYAYAQDEWGFAPDWALTAGVRRDAYSDFGSTTNPRLALVWDASLNVTAKLLHGRAFRSPSFNEQFGINPVNNGNPDVRPETIATTEAALAWQALPDLNVNVSVFRSMLRDLIRSVANPAPAPGSTYRNVGRIKVDGAELELAWDLGKQLRWEASYARQNAIDQGTLRDPGYAPRHHASSRLPWRFSSDWLFTPQVNWVAGRRRPLGDARAPVADYTTFDATLARNLSPGWTVSATVRNLNNADAREPSLAPGLALPYDLPVAPRTVEVQLSVRL